MKTQTQSPVESGLLPSDSEVANHLGHDLEKIVSQSGNRRLALQLAVAGVASGLLASRAGAAAATADSKSKVACAVLPEETAGPYPADGSNSRAGAVLNVLNQSGILRSDIRPSFGALSGTAIGIPLTVNLKLLSQASGCTAPLSSYVIYLWHCDVNGKYSLYDLPQQNYLRGVQICSQTGVASFKTIFPGCYAGRWPHMHFEIYPNQAAAITARNALKTSQLALPPDICAQVYNTADYATSANNMRRTSLERDMVFADDGAKHQMASMSGSLANDLTATLTMAI